ncbi:MAG TPA: tripartite tricarboxylate transporter substrate-binding protein, partial [Xanthobacteraceae bacterium]|nr:tripartite tricarboxylate transporter substrate-binding protein [Xanthobacteraceae bacterium]
MRTCVPRAAALAAFLCAFAAGPAAAQDYPTHPIKLIVGFPPGGGVDLVARLIGQEIGKGLGQPIVVENKPGAAGMIGAAFVAKSDPDGYTLLVTPGGHALYGAVFKSVPFDTVGGFSWISNVVNVPFFATVRADSRFRTLADVVAAARAAPGTISFGSAGAGSTHHLTGELLGAATGVEFLHVPYRGDAPVINALLAGEVDFAFATPTQVIANVAASKFRALATTAGMRAPELPDVPTVAEALGVKDFDVRTWFALAGPAGLPAPIVARLNAALREALTQADLRKGLATIGGEIAPTTPAEMRARVDRE